MEAMMMGDTNEITEASVVTCGRKRGRPVGSRSAEPGLTLSVRVYSSHYDRLSQMALRQDVPLAKLVRDILSKAVR